MTTTKRPVGANDNETPNDNDETSGDDDPMHAIIAAMMDIRGSHDRSAFRELKEKCLSVEISLQERAACLLRLPQECSYVGDGLSTALKDYKAAYELIVELIDVTTAKDVCAVVSKHVDDDHFLSTTTKSGDFAKDACYISVGRRMYELALHAKSPDLSVFE